MADTGQSEAAATTGRAFGDRIGLLAHPVFVAAVCALAVNDHLAKDRWPGLLTGKISDVAGVFVVAVALGVVAGRPRIAAVVTGLAFTALKLGDGVAELAAPVLGGATRRDPTDLIALLALPLAVRFVLGPRTSWPEGTDRAVERRGRAETDVDRSRSASPLRQGLAMASLAVAAFAVTATSCEDHPRVDGVFLGDDGIYVDLDGEAYRSIDRGRTWTATAGSLPGTRIDRDEECVADGRCFRVEDNRRVLVRSGESTSTAFAFSAEDVRRMAFRTDGCSGRGRTDELFASLSVVGIDRDEVLLVTMATQGILRLDVATGEWSRHAVGPAEPLRTDGPPWLRWLVFAPMVSLLIVIGGFAAFITQGTAVTRRVLVLLGAFGAFGTVQLIVFWMLTFSTPDYVDFGVSVAVASVVLLALAMAGLVPRGRDDRPGRPEPWRRPPVAGPPPPGGRPPVSPPGAPTGRS